MNLKFNIGDKVIHRGDQEMNPETKEMEYKGDESEQVREVLSVQIKEDGVYYTVTSRDVDIKARDVVNGTMTLKEEDLMPLAEFEKIKAKEAKEAESEK